MSIGWSSVDRRERSEYATVTRQPQPRLLQEKEANGNEQPRAAVTGYRVRGGVYVLGFDVTVG